MALSKKLISSLLLSALLVFSSNASIILHKKEDFLQKELELWSQLYNFHGRDNNDIEDELLTDSHQIQQVLVNYQGKKLTQKSQIAATFRDCVFGIKGAYGDHIDSETQNEIVDFVLGTNQRFLDQDYADYDFFRLTNHPADVAPTSNDSCALLILSKEETNVGHLGRIFQSSLND